MAALTDAGTGGTWSGWCWCWVSFQNYSEITATSSDTLHSIQFEGPIDPEEEKYQRARSISRDVHAKLCRNQSLGPTVLPAVGAVVVADIRRPTLRRTATGVRNWRKAA
jgi:hypothetical protein